MTSDSTTPSDPDERPEDVADAVVPPPPAFDEGSADAVVPPPPVFDDNRADVVVPPPPSFDGPLTGSVASLASSRGDDVVPPAPVFEGSTGDDVVPPPPAFDGGVTGAPASDSLRRRSLPPVAAPDPGPLAPEPDPAFVAPEVPASAGYRGWTVAIFSFLVLLLAGAIALVIYLATSTTLNFPSFDDAAADDRSETVTTAAPTAPAAPTVDVDDLDGVGVVAGQPCSAFCHEISSQVGVRVVGADGDVEWSIAEPWVSTEIGEQGIVESAVGTYSSSVGTLEFTVWNFDDDAAAQAGFEAQNLDRGEPTASDAVYADGTGLQNTYVDDAGMTIIWIVDGDDGHPWVMRVTGPEDSAVSQFYLALPI